VVILGALMVPPIYFVNTINDAAALRLARGADFLSASDKPQRDALIANEVFWGIWRFRLGCWCTNRAFSRASSESG
jgi:hypothetical protein